MPLLCCFKKEKTEKMDGGPPMSDKEKKSMFGLKVVQAQLNPGPIYDISGCSAPFLPNDTYTFCRLVGKATLNVKGNELTNLDSGGNLRDLSELVVLDASDNKIDKLPPSISALHNLKTLILSDNSLKSLPDSFVYLKTLEELNLSRNKLSEVPTSICALPRLQFLDLTVNNITVIPLNFCNLQKSLVRFLYDNDKIQNLLEIEYNDIQQLMKHLCNKSNIEYTGLEVSSVESDISAQTTDRSNVISSPDASETDGIMIAYMRKKQEQLKAQVLIEENFINLEKEQIKSILQSSSDNKEKILTNIGLSDLSSGADFEGEKQKKIKAYIELEEKSRNEEAEQLNLYLTNAADKDSLLKNLRNHESALEEQFKSIVISKDEKKNSLLKDLTAAEEETSLALEELLNCQPSLNSDDFINLIKEQDIEIQKLISGNIDNIAELRQSDVLKAMQDSMLKDAVNFAQRERTDETQDSWVSMLLKEGEIEASHLDNIMNEKAADQQNFINNLLEEEEYQEKAFRILLADMDMKRNDVIRQIALIEYELLRLSCLELRKNVCSVKYGSSTMLKQRNSLVELLESLYKAKNKRDQELDSRVDEMAHRKCENSEDFWLMQYQSLMNLKPPVLALAEENMDYKVTTILNMANAVHLIPSFAKHEITYDMLLDMSEYDFTKLNVGSATYRSIQRALNSYLSSTKLTSNKLPEGNNIVPSAPQLEASASFAQDDDASAPPLEESFLESECVVCLNNVCKVLFIPCGHICVCLECCTNITTCPLCRSTIQSKFSISAH